MKVKINLPKDYTPLKKRDGKVVYFFRYDPQVLLDAEGEDTGTVDVTEECFMMRNATYEKMVDACIAVKYDISAQLALLYNYQQDAEKYAEEMATYQEWRTYCKDACREFFNINE